jgi:hypothetical protein
MRRSRIGGLWSTLRCRLLRRSDVSHWSDPTAFDAEWDARARVAAALIPPGAGVVEFGAGLRQLERFLDQSISYIPSDLVDRGPGTLILDLNAQPLPSLSNGDTAVFCGVLEYIADVPAVIHWLSDWASLCIASYNCAYTSRGTLLRVAEVAKRARLGWVNTFTERELRVQFATAGFELVERRTWYETGDNEPVFVFRRRRQGSDQRSRRPERVA